jgi:hypothetical protein
MLQVRRGVFETNSSSTHSVCIARGEYVSAKLRVEDGILRIFTGEFGWGPDRFTDAPTKAAYCLTWIKEMGDSEDKTNMLINVLKQHTGANAVEFVPAFTEESKSEWDFYQWGYIDHQSLEGDGNALIKAWESEDTLAAFIFNSDSILVIDNDNH